MNVKIKLSFISAVRDAKASLNEQFAKTYRTPVERRRPVSLTKGKEIVVNIVAIKNV